MCEVIAHFVKQMPVMAMLVDEIRLARLLFIFEDFFFIFEEKLVQYKG